MKRRALITALLTVTVLLSTTFTRAAPAADGTAQWQIVPGVRADFGIGPTALGWVSNRAWIAHSGVGDDMPVTSVRIAGAALRGFKTTHYKTSPHVRLILGSELVYSTGQGGESLQARQLLASGGLGPPSAVPLDPNQISPNHAIGPQAAVRVGDRVVWALPGTVRAFALKGVLWVCCATDGSARELTRFIDRASAPNPVRLGLDERGRLWLAWKERGGVKIMELDPSSLLPRTTKPIVAPGYGGAGFELVCTAVCRLVIGDLRGIHSWAPGERTPTKIAKPVPGIKRPPELLAAAPQSGNLLVAAYYAETYGGTEVRVVRGDARGARSRVVAMSKGSFFMTHAVFVPAGLLVVTPKGALCEVCPVSIGLLRVTR